MRYFDNLPSLITGLMFCLFLSLSGAVHAANISVDTDLNPVVGEEFTLIFSSDEQPAGNPDFSPLSKDFEVARTSTSSNVRIVNNVASKELAWRVQVFPKKSGIVEIPPIQFGNDVSPATSIVVGKSSANNGAGKDGIIVELESDIESPYVQQQIIVTQRLLHSVPLRKSGATMSHPAITEGKGLVEQLGNIINKTMLRNGIQYKVSERRYAIFPQTSGKLTLGRTVFQGILDDGRKQRDPFFGMSGRQVRRFSVPLELAVKEQPAIKGGTAWLPANSLSINAHWQTPPDKIKTGEPVTLTLAVIADGLLAEQLPELSVKPPKGLKGYSNQPEFTNNSNGKSVIGTRQEKWILIGTAPGEYKLPEIWLNWWNLETGKLEVASVPEVRVTVTGAIPNSARTEATTPESLAAGSEANNETATPGTGGSESTSEELISPQQTGELPEATEFAVDEKRPFSPLWLWLAGIMAAAVFILAWVVRHRRTQAAKGTPLKVVRNRVNPLELLEKACKNDEPQKAYDALSDWVKQDLILSPATLSQLRKEADFPLKGALDDLSMALYSSQHDDWQGKALWQAVTKHRQPKPRQRTAGSGLLSLYPE